MKNVMNSLFFWKFEFVGLFVNWIQNLKKIEKFGFKLLILFDFDIFVVQPNFVTKNIAFRLCAFITSLFLKFLDMMKVFTAN